LGHRRATTQYRVLEARGGEPFGAERCTGQRSQQMIRAAPLTANLFHEGDPLRRCECCSRESETRADAMPGGRERDAPSRLSRSYRSQPLHGVFAARSPGARFTAEVESCFIDKNNTGTASTGFFLRRGQSCRRHARRPRDLVREPRAAASVAKSTSRGTSTRPMWAGWYETPNCCAPPRRPASRSQVVRYPAATGPWRSILVNAPLCFSESLGSGPGCGLAANLPLPPHSTSASNASRWSKLTPKKRSNFPQRLPFLEMLCSATTSSFQLRRTAWVVS